MSASQNKKKTLSLGLALIPVISMLLLLIIGYGIMGLPHGMKADSGWIRYWITWRKTAAGLLNRRQSTFPGQELSRRREPIYYGWIVKNWDWMTNS